MSLFVTSRSVFLISASPSFRFSGKRGRTLRESWAFVFIRPKYVWERIVVRSGMHIVYCVSLYFYEKTIPNEARLFYYDHVF
jgi:hypothetical protein